MKLNSIYLLFFFTGIFQLQAQWNQTEALYGGAANDNFGFSVSISGDGTAIVVGAPKFTINAYGYCYTYAYTNSTWEQKGDIIEGRMDSQFGPSNLFGWSVSMGYDGNSFIVGDPGSLSGYSNAYKYYETFGSWENYNDWILRGGVIKGNTLYDRNGHAVSISDDGYTLIAGTPTTDFSTINSGSDDDGVGLSYYNSESGYWSYTDNIEGVQSNERFGISVSLNADGTILASGIGKTYYENNKGGVRVYGYLEDSWEQLGEDIYGANNNDKANVVSLNDEGTILAIGSRYNDDAATNAGHVRVFEFVNDTWVQMGNTITGETAGDGFGRAISMNGEGNILAVGAPQDHDGIAKPGYVNIYQYENGEWVQLGETIVGDANNDDFGYAVSISTIGDKLIIGAPYNDENGTNAGQIKVYEYSGTLSVDSPDDIADTIVDDPEDVIAQAFNLYPNPASQSITLTNDEDFTIQNIRLFNSLGMLVDSKEVQASTYDYNVSSLASGTYFLKLSTSEGIIYKKILVE